MRRKKKLLVYGFALLLFVIIYGWRQKLDANFSELSTCPACYGQNLCHDLLEEESSKSSNIKLSGFSKWKIMKLLNVKNVYFGEMNTVSVVLKKMAHDSELYEFNKKLCRVNKEKEDCNVSQSIKSLLSKNDLNVAQIVRRYPHLFEKSDGVKCNHNRTLYYLYENFLKLDSGPYQPHHFLTMLAVNMEPLILNAYQDNWFPALHGMCGRVMVEEYVGPTLTQLADVPWITRVNYARQLLEMAQDFSNGKFRLYLTDVSLDNFAVSSSGKVKLIDAENIVMVDSNVEGLEPTEHVNEGFGCRDCLSFSYEDLCSHTSADHNFFAICKGMLSSHAFSRDLPSGLLHDPPRWVMEQYPGLLPLVEDCARPAPHDNSPPRRAQAAPALHSLLLHILHNTHTQ